MKIQSKVLASLAFTTMAVNIASGYEVVIDKTLGDFTRNNENQTVDDLTTGLMWQDDESAETVTKNWEEAKGYCQNLNFAGYSDWRLPTIDELKSIVDTNNTPAIKKEFKNSVSTTYWSSTPNADISSYAWFVRFYNGDDDTYVKYNDHYVRCVRDSK